MISINNGMLINSKIPCIIFRREEGRGKKEEGEEGEEIINHKDTETQRKKREHLKEAKKTVVGASRSLARSRRERDVYATHRLRQPTTNLQP